MNSHPGQPFAFLAIRGFTLVEMLLALALTSIVGLAVAMMLGGLGAGMKAQHDIRRASMKRQVAVARLGALTRSAAMVLTSAADHLVLWKGDLKGNGKPELSELRRIEWDSTSGDVQTYESPANLDPGSDVTYELTDDFGAATAAQAGSTAFPGQVTLQQVTQWDLELDSPSVQSARLMRLRVTIDQDSGADAATIISALRASES